MIRANLLPQQVRSRKILGFSIAVENLRRAFAMTLLAAALMAAVTAVQTWRERQLWVEAADLEAQLGLHSTLRRQVGTLAREVALLQRIEQEGASARYTGNRAALAIARLGNAIPRGAWLSAIDRRPDGYFISGSGGDYANVAATLRSLDRAAFARRARLAGASRSTNGVLFTVRVAAERSR
jgi:Tfp pilus assembly protein PilN